VVAFGGMLGGRRWMTVSGIGSFLFADLSRPVSAYPDDAVPDELVEDTYRRTVLPLALQALGREVLHASAVLGPSGVLAFCAVSGTGKSTIAYATSRRGYPLWSDDAVQFSLRNGDVDAIPLPFTLRLKGDSRSFFGGVQPTGVSESSPGLLAAIYVLERDARAHVTRLDAVNAFPAVLTHAYCFELADAERKRQMMDVYLKLVGRVPVFRVGVPTGLEHIDKVVDLILETESS
jgi:hypothetical protein